ncbi:L,D-transpeptidase family protein [Flavobacteriaceae bacterium SZ-1-7]|uniref:L,D-transpeptidase family protein n=1 Tax=Tamlana sedimenti TaxID=3134126 RepID=UPI0031221E4F
MNRFLQSSLILVLAFFVFAQVAFKIDKKPIIKAEAIEICTHDSAVNYLIVNRNIAINAYFEYLDSIVKKYDSVTSYKLTEHLLVRANPWIIDTLKNTDYYILKARGIKVDNQKEMVILNKGDTIFIPNNDLANKLLKIFNTTLIDLNIPEYKMRILEDSTEKYSFPVRVGRNEKKYLETAGRIIDLKTKIGNGTIIGYNKNPDYINPVNGHRYYVTKRDDNEVTKLPRIPFIETEINGQRYGQLIHPTTNPITLGKAYSNGCIGTKESDAWVIYYHAPINTKITIRYNLHINGEDGNSITLKDIYNKEK